ncbi:hypothetical protein HAX54_003177, partial [Datura stramonium]|nr:hypothetical protein [Datura stramonium]
DFTALHLILDIYLSYLPIDFEDSLHSSLFLRAFISIRYPSIYFLDNNFTIQAYGSTGTKNRSVIEFGSLVKKNDLPLVQAGYDDPMINHGTRQSYQLILQHLSIVLGPTQYERMESRLLSSSAGCGDRRRVFFDTLAIVVLPLLHSRRDNIASPSWKATTSSSIASTQGYFLSSPVTDPVYETKSKSLEEGESERKGPRPIVERAKFLCRCKDEVVRNFSVLPRSPIEILARRTSKIEALNTKWDMVSNGKEGYLGDALHWLKEAEDFQQENASQDSIIKNHMRKQIKLKESIRLASARSHHHVETSSSLFILVFPQEEI